LKHETYPNPDDGHNADEHNQRNHNVLNTRETLQNAAANRPNRDPENKREVETVEPHGQTDGYRIAQYA
jgi:hypothetical protein